MVWRGVSSVVWGCVGMISGDFGLFWGEIRGVPEIFSLFLG
jgi:hypothetical protein